MIPITTSGFILLILSLIQLLILVYLCFVVTRILRAIRMLRQIRPIDILKENYDHIPVTAESKPEQMDGQK